MDKDDEERIQEAIERQIERALASKKDVSHCIIAISICTIMKLTVTLTSQSITL